MRGLGILFILSASSAFGCAFLSQASGFGSGSVILGLLGTALAVSGSTFLAAHALAGRLRDGPQAAAARIPEEPPRSPGADQAVTLEPGHAAAVVRRPGFHRDAA